MLQPPIPQLPRERDVLGIAFPLRLPLTLGLLNNRRRRRETGSSDGPPNCLSRCRIGSVASCRLRLPVKTSPCELSLATGHWQLSRRQDHRHLIRPSLIRAPAASSVCCAPPVSALVRMVAKE